MTLFAHHQPSSQNMVKMSRSVVKDTATNFMTIVRLVKINSQLSRRSTATGSGYPWEVPLRLSLFNSLKALLKLKIKTTWLILLSHSNRIICLLRICLLSVDWEWKDQSQICQFLDRLWPKWSKINKSCHICIRCLKVALVSYEKYGTLSINHKHWWKIAIY